jgi:hypothetical protein
MQVDVSYDCWLQSVTQNTFNPTKMMQSYGLSSSQITAELSLLSNALDFHNKTGRIDVAYDGFFFANDLNVTKQVVSWTKPEYASIGPIGHIVVWI